MVKLVFDATQYTSRPMQYATGENPRSAFLKELNSKGFHVQEINSIGQIERCQGPGDKPSRQSGWWIYYEIADESMMASVVGIGVFGSWKGDPERIVWSSKHTHYLSQEDRRLFNERIEHARLQREATIKEAQTTAAYNAKEIWESATDGQHEHPYTIKKKITPHGAKTSRRSIHDLEALVIPILYEGEIVSLQFIKPDGEKKFLPDGRIKGCYSLIGQEVSSTVLICEGWATGCTLHDATGAMVYVAFNAGNLFDVANYVRSVHKESQIVICGDDDRWSPNNVGKIKALTAAEAVGGMALLPEFQEHDLAGCNAENKGPTDFNDMANLYGIEAVSALVMQKPKLHEAEQEQTVKDVHSAPGILGDLAAYYNATSGNKQHGFAIQTALAIGSIVCSRVYRTTKDNFTSLYFLNVAKSSTGKEHAKTVIEKVLHAAGMDYLVAGDGYTSAGAVFSALLAKPRHISVIDEFGRYLEAAKAAKSSNQLEANTKLMEAISRCHSILRPPTYSTMTLPKDKAADFSNRKVHNPAITIMSMTTPVTLFANVDSRSIADGFLNRFIICLSDTERAVREHKDAIDVPSRILDWIAEITKRAQERSNIQESASEAPVPVVLDFDQQAYAAQQEFQEWCIDQQNKLDFVGMGELPGRSNEMAMRISLIVALAENPRAEIVTGEQMAWAIDYVKTNLERTIKKLKMSISGSEFEGRKKEALEAIRKAGAEGISKKDMNKAQPFAKWTLRDRGEILAALIEAELVTKEIQATHGRSREVYFPLA